MKSTKPSSVFSLLLLVYIGAGFTLLIAIEQFIAAGILGRETDAQAIQSALINAGVAPGYAEQAQGMVQTLAIVSLVAAIAHVVLAVFIARRANWARIVLIILVAIGTFTDITWVIQGRWFSGLMLTIYDIAILVLAFAPATAQYCRKVNS
ncbi:MAG: hypothetical protein RJB01_389 [Actinomycetota bacterium]|jgi:hypothetical protein